MANKIFICMPAFGQVNTAFTTASLVATTRFLTERGEFGGFGQISYPDIAELRAIFLSIFYYKVDATHILFVDADMSFEPQLVLDMIDSGLPVVGCLYPKRTLPLQWVGSALEGEPEIENGFLKVEGIGFGVTLISRSAVDHMIGYHPNMVDDDVENHAAGKVLMAQGVNKIIRAFDPVRLGKRRLSEDFSFCARYRESGGEVWAAINHKITHVGNHGYAGRYADVIDNMGNKT